MVDVSVPQVVGQLFVVANISSQTESCNVPWKRFLAVLVMLLVAQFVIVTRQFRR